MAFAGSSSNIHLVGSTLHADCGDATGKPVHSQLQLDDLLGNLRGRFVWLGSDFSQTAESVTLEGSVLHARLYDGSQFRPASIDLNERITNSWGSMHYLDRELGIASPRGTSSGRQEPNDYLYYEGVIDCDDQIRRVRDAKEAHDVEVQRFLSAQVLSEYPAFKHPHLPSKTSIRLLHIEDSEEACDMIKCHLVAVDLNLQPAYDALSYTWGNPFDDAKQSAKRPNGHFHGDEAFYERETEIMCNGQRLAVKQNLFDALRRLRRTYATERRGSFDKPPLVRAAEEGHFRLVESLVLQGANILAQDMFGETALHYAAENGHFDVVRLLVPAGSSLTILDNSKRTPLDCAKQRQRDNGRYDETIAYLEAEAKRSDRPRVLQVQNTARRFLWVDAICIDQANKKEKAQQVAFMGRIYSSARSVIVWLGKERKDSRDTAAEDLLLHAWELEAAGGRVEDSVLKTLLSHPDRHMSTALPAKLQSAVQKWLAAIGDERMQRWLLTVPFFERRWFRRGWVVQELIMAQDTTVLCGQFAFSWDLLVLVSCVVAGCRHLMLRGKDPLGRSRADFSTFAYGAGTVASQETSSEPPPLTMERARRTFREKGPLTPLTALSLGRNFEVQDARDKIFATLSFSAPIEYANTGKSRVIPGKRFLRVVPDYEAQVESLYVSVAKSLLEAHGLRMLSLVRYSKRQLPSWVPDLQTTMITRPLGIRTDALNEERVAGGERYNAAGSQDTPFAQLMPDNSLLLKAYRWDVIEEVGRAGLSDIQSDFGGITEWARMVSGIPGSRDERLGALGQTFLCDDSHEVLSSPDFKKHFLAWIEFMVVTQLAGFRPVLRDLKRFDRAGDAFKERSFESTEATEALITSLEVLIGQEAPFSRSELNERQLKLRSAMPTSDGPSSDLIWLWGFIERSIRYGGAICNSDLSRRLVVTKNGHLGAGPPHARAGDAVCIIPGTNVPYLLRRVIDQPGRYRLVGEAYVHGIMHGEAERQLKHLYEISII